MANRTISNAGGHWSSNATWVEGSPPDNTMDVVATGTSGPVDIDTTTCVCKSMVLTGYTALMTFTAAKVLTVSGNVTFASTHTLTGTGTLKVNAAATLTSGTLTFPGALTISVAATIAWGDNWTVTGTVTQDTGAGVWNGNQITANTSLTATTAISGTTLIVMGGTGTISTGGSSVAISNPITINTLGTITIGANIAIGTGCVFTWIAGIISGTSGTNIWTRGNATFDLKGTALPTFRFNVSATITLLSNFKATYLSISTTATFSGAFNVECDYFQDEFSFVNGGARLIMQSGTTIQVNKTSYISGDAYISPTLILIASSIASSPINFVFLGTANNWICTQMNFTDVNMTGSVMSPMPNYWGGALTRCTGIVNYVPTDRKIGYTPVGMKYGSDGAPEMLTFKPASVS